MSNTNFIENRMVVDSEWEYVEPVMCEPQEVKHGYESFPDMLFFVLDDEALEYARRHAQQEDMTDKEFVDWFFSGNWIRR